VAYWAVTVGGVGVAMEGVGVAVGLVAQEGNKKLYRWLSVHDSGSMAVG
jgi:hypothetical protein